MAWVGQRRSGSHPRIAPVVPAIADKVRSYGLAPYGQALFVARCTRTTPDSPPAQDSPLSRLRERVGERALLSLIVRRPSPYHTGGHGFS
ncbi:hypothetical protein CW310_05290 [Pseudomonas citronellolis]|nr:hypothetical protein CW310_05290 [Pseudomonas citronellolis]